MNQILTDQHGTFATGTGADCGHGMTLLTESAFTESALTGTTFTGTAVSTRNSGLTPRLPRSNDITTTTGAFGTDAMGPPPREPIPV